MYLILLFKMTESSLDAPSGVDGAAQSEMSRLISEKSKSKYDLDFSQLVLKCFTFPSVEKYHIIC